MATHTPPRTRKAAPASRTGAMEVRGVPAKRRVSGRFVVDLPDGRRRGRGLMALLLVAAVVLGGRLVDLQLRQHTALAAQANRQHQSVVPIAASRGRIFDRTGRVLAADTRVWEIFADPGLIPEAQRDDVSRRLAPILNMGPGRIHDLISVTSRFVVLAHGVGDDVKAKLRALNLPGLGTVEEHQRVYNPSAIAGTSFASNLLGFVDHSGTWQYGVESYYNATLTGHNGQEATVHDIAGNAIALSNDKTILPQNGRDLRLGLDPQVQFWAEQALAQGVTSSKAESGTAMVMDTKTGAIRAWADYPSYDANHYTTAPFENIKDTAVSSLYEPGSVMKTVTFAGGLNQRVITPDYAFNEAPVNIDGFVIRDWDNQAHGNVTMQYVLSSRSTMGRSRSCNSWGSTPFIATCLPSESAHQRESTWPAR